jgi:O-antigen/teichoic acid export membrane protein
VSATIDPPTTSSPSEPESGLPQGELGRVAVGGVGWEGLSLFAGKTLLLVSTIILARILTPNDFGVVALALVFVEYADVVADLGVAQAVVYLPPSARTNDAAFALSLVWSVLLVAGAMLAAPLVASFFHRPDIVPMFRALSLCLLLGGTAEVPEALMYKSLHFRRRLRATLSRAVAQGLVSIVLAVAGLGAWSIVLGYLTGALVWNVAIWSLVDYRPTASFWRLRRSDVDPLLRFGLPAAGTSLILVLLFNIDYLIVGRRLGPEALAFYTIAFRIPELVMIKVYYMLSRVAFPMFSIARGEPARLRRGYLASVRLQATYGALAGVGLALVAPMAVPVLFGARWAPAVVPLEALGLYAALRSLDAIDLYKGLGRPGLAVKLSLIRLAVLAPVLWAVARLGIGWVAWTQVGLALAAVVMMQVVAARVVGVSLRALGLALRPVVAVGIGTALGAGAVRLFVPGSDALRLALAIVAGGAGALGAVWLLERGFLHDTTKLVSRRSVAGSTSSAAGG